MLNVCWLNHERITCACATMVNQTLDQYVCEHYYNQPPKNDAGAVIIFHGGNSRDIASLNDRAAALPWSLGISVGDESCEFPYGYVKTSQLWVQTPKPGKVKASRYLLEGYMPDTRDCLRRIGDIPRDLDWSFLGQMNHARREHLKDVLRDLPNGSLLETHSFGAGLPHDDYYRFLRRSKIVPCPAGPATPDSFRFAEALEAGCIPVLDAHSLDGVRGYWDMVLGPDHPFKTVDDWSTFPAILDSLLRDWEKEQRLTQFWWRREKLRLKLDFDHAILSLQS